MRARTVLALAVALLALLAVLVALRARRPDSAIPRGSAVTAPAQPAAAGARIREPEAGQGRVALAPEGSPPSDSGAAAEAGGLEVRVLVLERQSGAPVEGVECVLYAFAEEESNLAVTDREGRALLHAPGPGRVLVEATAAGAAYGSVPVELELDRAGEPPEVVLRVAVYPETVRLWARDAESAAMLLEARFLHVAPASGELEALPARGGYLEQRVPLPERPLVVVVEAPDHHGCVVFPVEATPEPLVAELGRTEPIEVQVVVAGRPPQAACIVRWSQRYVVHRLPRAAAVERYLPPRVLPEGRSGEAVTGPDGRCTLPLQVRCCGDVWPPTVSLEVEGPGGLRGRFGDIHPGSTAPPPWILELQPGLARVEVSVVAADGTPVPDCRVFLYASPLDAAAGALRPALYSHDGASDAAGSCAAEVLAPSVLFWRVTAGEQSVSGEEKEPVVPGEMRRVQVRLPSRLLAIAGRLLRHDGGALQQAPEASVEVQRVGEDGLRQSGVVAADGSFRVGGLAPGRYRVWIELWHYSGATPAVETEAGDEALLLHLPELATLEVRAVDALTGAPIPDCVICWANADEWCLTECSGDGTFELKDGARLYDTLLLWDRSHEMRVVDLAAKSTAELADLVVPLEPGRRLALRLLDSATGRPLEQVAELRWLGLPPMARSLQDLGTRRDGLWEVQGETWSWWPAAPRRAFRLQAHAGDGTPLGPPVEVPAGAEDVALEVSLP